MAKGKLPPEALEFFKRQGSIGGAKGGKLRMDALSPEQRSELARKAVQAREAKRAASKKRSIPAKNARKKSLSGK